jgi:Family of unknown function (DUF5343)
MNDDAEIGKPDNGNGKSAAVYVGWTTFKSCILEGLAQGGIPNSINRSVWPGQSFGVQAQLVASVKFLGLVDDKGKPTKALHDLTVEDEAKRKQVLATILRARYADVFALDVERTTIQELTETMAASYNVGGDTKEKAVRFFLSAAQYAEIPLSKRLTVSGGNTRRRPRRAKTAEPSASAIVAEKGHVPLPAAFQPVGEQRTFALASGATLTLSTSVGFMKLAKSDRDFVAGLIDQLDAYEADNDVEADADDQP